MNVFVTKHVFIPSVGQCSFLLVLHFIIFMCTKWRNEQSERFIGWWSSRLSFPQIVSTTKKWQCKANSMKGTISKVGRFTTVIKLMEALGNLFWVNTAAQQSVGLSVKWMRGARTSSRNESQVRWGHRIEKVFGSKVSQPTRWSSLPSV